MDDRMKAIEERLERIEATLQGLAERLSVSADDGIALRGPLRVVDSEGKPLVQIDLGEDGPCLRLLNGRGETAVLLDVVSASGSISVHGPDGRTVGLLFADETGGDFALYDQDGQIQYSRP